VGRLGLPWGFVLPLGLPWDFVLLLGLDGPRSEAVLVPEPGLVLALTAAQ
jgi:hypothetical protein